MFGKKSKYKYKIRYNTKAEDSVLKWRVFIDGEQHLASHVDIEGWIWTTSSVEGDEEKWNFETIGNHFWSGTSIYITSGRSPIR